MAITASAVKELRELTSAGMMACKKALTETNGDFEAAAKLLREKGEAKRSDRADRETSEGIVAAFVSSCAKTGVLAEINCETDFVAKNEAFQAFVGELVEAIANSDAADADAALSVTFGEGTVENALGAKFAELGEVIKISRLSRFAVPAGAAASYIHMGGKVGVLIEVATEKPETTSEASFQELVKDITLHVAAANPAGLTRDDIDASTVEEENEINRKQLEAAGKPANIIDNILKGKINKFYSEQVLLEQSFVKDPDLSITQLIEAKSKELGDTLKLVRYERFSIGA
ncbi:translation elongation factor Ts [Rubritalea marina]|uniref:translation elongation factor Ts n=1 Tax=Rubritalea marina TaxID=361055 RepID=UPI00037645E0|nr:translation elongation factor Ts [Rubritalea marina]